MCCVNFCCHILPPPTPLLSQDYLAETKMVPEKYKYYHMATLQNTTNILSSLLCYNF